jgi:hypothetical protein
VARGGQYYCSFALVNNILYHCSILISAGGHDLHGQRGTHQNNRFDLIFWALGAKQSHEGERPTLAT